MRVSNVQYGQNFGMAFKLKGMGADALAEHFHSFSDPKVAEKAFVKEFVEPLKKLKSDVIYDGSNVVVHDSKSAKAFEILDAKPNTSAYKGKTTMDYEVKALGVRGNRDSYSILYGNEKDLPDSSKFEFPGFERQLAIAKEIAADLDRHIPTVESQKDTANRLKNLYA